MQKTSSGGRPKNVESDAVERHLASAAPNTNRSQSQLKEKLSQKVGRYNVHS